jgi:hypothetical protein
VIFMQAQIRTFEQQVSSATIWRLFSPEDSVTVHLNMSERENERLPLAKRTTRGRISADVWEQTKTAYASGIGLREIARSMGIPAGTILSRAKREAGSKQISDAKSLAKREDTSTAVTTFKAVSASMQQRGERHLSRMANIVEKTLPHIEGMEPGAILDRVDDVDTLDKIGRRTFRLDDNAAGGGIELLQILSIGGAVNLGKAGEQD